MPIPAASLKARTIETCSTTIADPDRFLRDWRELIRNQIGAAMDQQRPMLAQHPTDQTVARVVHKCAQALEALRLDTALPDDRFD